MKRATLFRVGVIEILVAVVAALALVIANAPFRNLGFNFWFALIVMAGLVVQGAYLVRRSRRTRT